MRIKILGGGWYGCSIAEGFIHRGADVELHDIAPLLFSGASGSNPARLHQGQHYPRSKLTRAFCQEHHGAFMARYGGLTRSVPVNLYAIAEANSLVDFGTYQQVLRNEIEFITVYDPSEFGLKNVEGAILTGERHIVIDEARKYFTSVLSEVVHLGSDTSAESEQDFDYIIDCTFCSRDNINIDRFEACVTYILAGPTERAVTIMDGPFPSLYPWNEAEGLSSLTSAKYTPIAKCPTWQEANEVLQSADYQSLMDNGQTMFEQLCHYWPQASDMYEIISYRKAIRAMPKSAADARLVDIVQTGNNVLRVRAGKIDAVIHAEEQLWDMVNSQ